MKRLTIPALLATVIVAALAAAVWSGSSRADACSRLITRVVHGYWATMWISCEGVSPWDLFDQDTSGEARFGSWLYDVHGNLIPGDAVRPGVVEEYTSSGPRSLGVYVGDRVRTPWVDANDRLRYSVSEVAVSYGHNIATGAQYITTPQRPAVSADDQVVYTFGSNHRAVLGADGNYYREELLRGGWQRSGSYGDDEEALRKASLNAYLRSRGELAIDPALETFPSSSVPEVGVSQTLVSTTGQSPIPTANWSSYFHDLAQAFTTGIHEAGYRVTQIGILTALDPGWSQRQRFDFQIWSDSNSTPGHPLVTLEIPSSISAGVMIFTVPDGGFDLLPNTQYWVVGDSHLTNFYWRTGNTNSNAEDAGGSLGWSIADDSYFRPEQYDYGHGGFMRSNRTLMITITGYPK